MAKYQQYAEYKDSGVEWLGKIPHGWKVLRGKYVFQEFRERSTTGEEVLLSVSEYYGVKPRSEKISEGDHLSRAESLVDYKKCYKNDLVMNIMLAWKRGLGVSKYDGIVSPAYSVFRFNEDIHPYFMHHLFRTDLYTSHFKTRSTGVIDSRLRLYPESFLDTEILIPSYKEQVQIANFLDHETAKIDTLIDKQQTLIKLLKEKRQAVISHAVTKGLNPDAPMKDSGVEWLGEVPEHWTIVKLSYRMKLLSGDGITSQDIEPTGQYPVYGGNGLRGYTDRYNCEGHHVLIGRQGALCGNINLAQGKFFATEHAVVVYPYQDFNISFLSEFLRFMDLGQYSVSAAQPGISVERINGLKILVPPYYEQTEIGEHVENIIKRFEDLSTKANQQIKLLQERRTALISAAVTGKIDVRGWQAPESKTTLESL